MPPYGRLRPTNLSEAAYDYQPRITPTGYWDKFKNQLEDNLNAVDNPFTGRGVGTDARSFVQGLMPQPGDEASEIFSMVNPLEAPVAGIAGAIVPKKLWTPRIDKVVEGMKQRVSRMQDIPRAEKFVSSMERWMRELHPEIAAHVNQVKIYSPMEADNILGKGTQGSYHSGFRRWQPNEVSDRAKFLDRTKDMAAAARYVEEHGTYPPDMDSGMWPDLDRFMEKDAADFDAVLNNKINLRESPDWANPLEMFDTPRHEYGHAAQDLGFTNKFDKAVEQYKDFKNKPHLYPQQPIEIGARVSGRKSARDAGRLGLIPEGVTEPVLLPARGLWSEEVQGAANRSMAAMGKGSGRNTIQGIAQRTIPDINKALKFKKPIAGRVLEPSRTRAALRPTGPGWQNKQFDWGPWGRYSLFVDEPAKQMTIEEMIERGFLK